METTTKLRGLLKPIATSRRGAAQRKQFSKTSNENSHIDYL